MHTLATLATAKNISHADLVTSNVIFIEKYVYTSAIGNASFISRKIWYIFPYFRISFTTRKTIKYLIWKATIFASAWDSRRSHLWYLRDMVTADLNKCLKIKLPISLYPGKPIFELPSYKITMISLHKTHLDTLQLLLYDDHKLSPAPKIYFLAFRGKYLDQNIELETSKVTSSCSDLCTLTIMTFLKHVFCSSFICIGRPLVSVITMYSELLDFLRFELPSNQNLRLG